MNVRRPGGQGGARHHHTPPPVPVFNKCWERIICVASGPSLTAEQGFRISTAGLEWKVIAVNNTWQRVPMAHVLYAGDQNWWKHHHMHVREKFEGECWTQDRWSAHRYGLCHVRAVDEPGLCHDFGLVHSGGNSGYVAVNLAYHFGAREIVLVGYDMQLTYGMTHWHGDHPMGTGTLPEVKWSTGAGSENIGRIGDWCDRFRAMAEDLMLANVRVRNASIETALPWFDRCTLEEALCQ